MCKEMIHKNIENEQEPPLAKMIEQLAVPKAFMQNANAKQVLRDLINDFNFEEKQVIYYYFAMDEPTVADIARITELSVIHVISVLNLYAERLTAKLDFFKKIIDYDVNELLPVSELLFLESLSQPVKTREITGGVSKCQ